MSDLIDRYQNLVKTGVEYAEQDKGNAPTSNFEIYMGHFASLFSEIHTALSEVNDRVKNARREALEEAAKTIEEGFYRGIASKRDLCAHKKFKWEDCEPCAANAVRALIPSEPHDVEGRE